jgi:glycosyltransferase involved in cell wall biosynthesis
MKEVHAKYSGKNRAINKRRRVAIVYPAGNLDSVPSLCNTAVLLAEHGYWVDVFTYFDDVHVRPVFQNARISILPASISGPRKRSISWRFLAGGGHFLLRLLVRHLQAPYVCVIGADLQGLIRAHRLITRWIKVPLVYYSLELWPSYDLVTEQDRALKAQERVLSRQAAFVIIQDEERAALLARDNQLSLDRMICVPNAPLGPASHQCSDYLRQRFSLSADTKIVLCSGAIGAWACIHQLVRSTQDWPDNWVLVCHNHSRGTSPNYRDYTAALLYLAKPGRVFFSDDPLPRHKYPELVQSADVGVAFYCVQPGVAHMQDNIRYIGLSSGKLAYYLQAGLPVIVNNVPSLRRLVTTYHCGEVTDDPSLTVYAIERILSNYETYSHNAVTCFNQELDFLSKFDEVLDALARLP